MFTQLDLSIKSYFESTPVLEWSYLGFLKTLKSYCVSEGHSLSDLKSIWRKRYLTFLSKFLTEEHDEGIKGRVTSLIRQGRPPEEESFWDGVRIERELMIKEDLFDKKSQIEALDVLCVSRSRKSGEYISKVNSYLKQVEMAGEKVADTIIGQKRSYEEELSPTPSSKARIIRAKSLPYQQYDDDASDDDIIKSGPLINISATTSSAPTPSQAKGGKKFINCDLADEVLKSFQMHILPDHKLIYDDVDVMEFARSIMKTTKVSQTSKSPLSIGIIDIHNAECVKYLPQGFKKYLAEQVRDTNVDVIQFSEGKYIDKFVVDCEEEVLQYLEKFDNVNSLKSLGECLDKNRINHSTSSNDLIYVTNLFHHFLLLYKNDVLTRPQTETELETYVWTPMVRYAFLGKADWRLKCGEVASKSYEKLKEILNIAIRSDPRLDGIDFLKSLDTKILAQEGGAINTQSKREGDLQKLEYCSKIILTTLFFAIPSDTKDKIKDLEVYSLQSNEFQLKITASKFLFEDTIVAMELARVEIPRTVEGFSKLLDAVKVILSWKARARKNTMMFYDSLRGHECLSNGAYFHQ